MLTSAVRSPTPAAIAGPLPLRTAAMAGATILLAVLLGYAPVFRAGFVWDDDAHVTVQGLQSLHGLWLIWFEPGATQQYYPLLHSAFWLEHRLWGDAPLGYHLANLALHVGVVCAAGWLLRQLAVPGALFAALLFALHPVHVESVGWISEQKNTLSAFLGLCAAIIYLRFDADRRPAAYIWALIFFALGLLTKTVIATLPAALLVILWWRRGSLRWHDVRPLLPWLALAIVAGTFTAFVERKLIGAEGAAFDLSLLQRVLLMGRVFWFYLGKLLWPHGLVFFYPRWRLDPSSASQWAPAFAALVAAVVLWRSRHLARHLIAASLLFVGTLFPVLGFFNIYPFLYSFVADHFQYLASLPICALAGAGLAKLPMPPRVRWCLATLALLPLALLMSQQARFYRDAPTLYRAVLARNPDSWIAHNNLGKELLADQSQLPAAIAHFERALALRPDYAEAHNNLGLAFTQAGRPAEAIPHLEESIRLKPNVYQAHNNLGIALASQGRIAEALRHFERAVALNPSLADARANRDQARAALKK